MEKYVVDRSEWRCGGYGPNALGEGNTMLLNYRGYSDIVGVMLLQMGHSRETIRGHSVPNALFLDVKHLTERDANDIPQMTKFCRKLMNLNDNEDLDTATREESLKSLAASRNIELEFVGKGLPTPNRRSQQDAQVAEAP